MGKDDLRLIENITYFSKLLEKNFKSVLQERNLIFEEVEKEARKETVNKTKDELLILSEIWKKINHIKYKRKANKPRKNAKELNVEKEKRKILNNHLLRDRNFILVKKYLKIVCSEQKKQNIVHIELGELIFLLRKYLEDKVTVLFPKVESVQYISETNIENHTLFSKISNQIPFVISLIHLITGTVINLNLNIENSENLLENFKNMTIKVKLNNFNFHYIYESNRNTSPFDLNRNYRLKNFNSKNNLELLDKRFKEFSMISLNLKSSEFDYYNQMTLGMRKRIEDYNYMTVDPKGFFTKFLIFCTRYLKLGLKSKNIFCNDCKKYFIINQDSQSIEYPVINLQKEFYHFSCSKNIEK